jgi:lipoprotein NlpI
VHDHTWLAVVHLGICVSLASAGEATPSPNAELLRRAETAYRRQQHTTAVQLATTLIEQDEQSLDAFRLRARAYEALRQFDRAIADLNRSIELAPHSPDAYQARGQAHFKAGHVRASVDDFDRFLSLRPERKPQHWQRGISLYYAGEFEKGVEQFELHKTVNPDDVENAVWHYLCKARVDGPDKARALLIPITDDTRPWAMTVYRMVQGKVTPRQALDQAERISETEPQRRHNLFYTHLYVGLYHEAAGQADRGREHIRIAVKKYPSPHYMGDVARVHLGLDYSLRSTPSASPGTKEK